MEKFIHYVCNVLWNFCVFANPSWPLRCWHTTVISHLHDPGVLKSYSVHITRHRAGTNSGDTKHLSNQNILLSHYWAFYMHVYRGHAAGTKSQLTQTIKHSSGNTSQGLVAAIDSCLVHMRRAVAGACIGGARQGQHQIAYIHLRLQPLHVPGTWSRSQILFDTYEWKCSQQRKRIYAHTLATAVIACSRDMYPQAGCCIFWVLRATRFHTYVLSLQHVLPKFSWLNFMRHVAATNAAKRTIFTVWTARERASTALLQI